jgi:hypothetical protein
MKMLTPEQERSEAFLVQGERNQPSTSKMTVGGYKFEMGPESNGTLFKVDQNERGNLKVKDLIYHIELRILKSEIEHSKGTGRQRAQCHSYVDQ